jgi:high frequency lysogenization protein
MTALKSLTHQTIALAGIAQAAALVQQLATTGKIDQNALETSVYSLLQLQPKKVVDVFQSLNGLKYGLEHLEAQITGYGIPNPEQARYATSLIVLELKLAERPNMLKTITRGIQHAELQVEHFELTHENVLASLGDLYTQTISQIHPKIIINGDKNFLQQASVVNKIRTLLLAGIRAVMLWRQCGGSRLNFLFQRGKLQKEVAFLRSKL